MSLDPSRFEVALIWEMAFVGFALAQLNKQKWLERAGFGPLIIALWITFF